MVTRRVVLGGLLLSLTVGIPAQVVAQDDLAIAKDPTLWPGLQTVIERTYPVDPNGTPSLPADDTRQIILRVYTFATVSDAEHAYA